MAARQKILILDDEQDLLEIYQEILARLPSQPEIRTATTGQDAIAILENEPFVLLLGDLNMPQMDGFQVLAVVRRRFPALRTVVMTGASETDLRARAYRVGVDLYMEKPKTGREIIFFVDCIESLLGRDHRDDRLEGRQLRGASRGPAEAAHHLHRLREPAHGDGAEH